MTNNRTILITGVTGAQGGAVAQALQGAGFPLRGMTRKPDSERAAALARQGVDIVKGDFDDLCASLRRALAGAPWAIFGVQNGGEAGASSGKRRQVQASSRRCWREGRCRTLRLHLRGIRWSTSGRASRTSTINGASRETLHRAASRSPRDVILHAPYSSWRTCWHHSVSRAPRWPGRSNRARSYR